MSHAAEQFSWVSLPYCSPPGCPFPIKSPVLSIYVSPQTIHFWMLDKSPVSGPEWGPPSCNKIIQLTFNILTLKEKRNRAKKTSPTCFDRHPDLISAGKSRVREHPESPLGKVSKAALWVRLQRLQSGVPIYNPRMEANWYHHPSVTKLQTWFHVNAVCLVKLGMLLSLGLGWPGSLQGLNNVKVSPLSYLW